MLDDHARAARLREAPRADLAMGERVFRFLSALQIRIVRELARLDPHALRHADAAGRRGDVWVIEGGAVFARGRVEVGDVPSEPGTVTTALAVDLQPVDPDLPGVRLSLRYTSVGDDPLFPEAQWFDAEARLGPVSLPGDAVVHFDGVWTRVGARHPGVVGVEGLRTGEVTPLPHCDEEGAGGGFRVERLDTDPEGAFLFVREAGRAFLPAYLPLVERSAGRSGG